MEFTCIATGSTGNCYLVKTDKASILLDAGISIDRIVKNVNLNNLNFAFISHAHNDHSKSMQQLIKRGVKVYSGTIVEKFTYLPSNPMSITFPVIHGDDAHGFCKCAGLIIQTADECILYITDFNACEYDLSGFKFTSIIIEANYLKHMVARDENFARVRENIYRHRSLESTLDFIDKNINKKKLKEIILCHMSEGYGDSVLMGSMAYSRFKLPVGVCLKNGGVDWYGRG